MKLEGYAQLTAKLRLKSGLHVGSGEPTGKGEPLPVLKSVIKRAPYIPGSSLKGKMRCLLEITYGRTTKGEGPCSCGRCQICQLFGSGNASTTYEPTRAIFRDSFLTPEFEGIIGKLGLENKPGVSINRKTGAARGGAMFPMERVPEGSEFNFEIPCRIFEGDDKEAIRKWLAVGLYLLEQDTIGGSGSRGSGHIEFDEIKFDGKEFDKNWREECLEIKNTLLDKVPIKSR